LSYPERIVPAESEPGIVALHLKRYLFAAFWCRGREVLDAACGVGYGSAELGKTAARVLGVDVNEEAVAYARSRYAAQNVEFEVMDLAALALDDASYDTVCAFEAIEHVSDQAAVLGELARVLRPSGTFIASTPRAERTTDSPENPFHTVEYAPGDFEQLLGGFFERVELYGQRRLVSRRHRLLQRVDVLGVHRRIIRPPRVASVLVGTRPTVRVRLEDIVIERAALDRATEIVAVCSGPRRG
jgi:SAM-dependent methyltransferase